MLYWLAQSDYISVFNLFRYIFIRAGSAIATAIFLALFFRWLISQMDPGRRTGLVVRRESTWSQNVSGIESPAMDAPALLSATFVSILLWANFLNSNIWIVIGTAIGFGWVGFCDERATHQGHRPFSRRTRLLIETIIAVGAWTVTYMIRRKLLATSPGVEERSSAFSLISMVLGAVLIVCAANAVKLLDGVYRFAMAAGVVGITAYLTGNLILARDFHLPFVTGTGELAIPCAAVAGGLLGIVLFKAPPAPSFIGEMGSLANGAVLGVVGMAIWTAPAP